MASVVTVAGAHSQVISLQFDSVETASLALKMASAIGAAVANGTMAASSDASGPPPPLPTGTTGEFAQTHSGVVMLPAGYAAVEETAASGIVFGSSAQNQMILSTDTSNLTFYASAGAGTVAAGGGNNLLSIANTDSGNWLLAVANGNNTIRALGSGNDTIETGTGQNALTLGGGADSIVSAGNDTITGTTGTETVNATGALSDVVYAGSSRLTFVGGSGPVTITGGAGADTYFGATGGNVGAQLVYGGTGGPNYLASGSGTSTLVGGSGNDTFVGGAGNASLTAGADPGSDTFLFVNGQAGGNDVVGNIFDAADVHIVLSGYGPNEVANAVANQTSTRNSVGFSLSDGTHITLLNITSLHSSNFS